MNREGCLRRVVSDTVSLDRLCHRVWMLLGPLVACSVSQSLCACVNAWF